MKNYVSGNIKKIIYQNDVSPYKVGILNILETNISDLSSNETIGFTGEFSTLNSELEYVFYGELIDHPKYGIQFKVETYEVKEPDNIDGLISYLSSGIFKGIGPKTAERIVERFGDNTINIIKNDYQKLIYVSGMTISKAQKIHDTLIGNEMEEELILNLSKLGFNIKESINLLSIYGKSIIRIIETNIFELMDLIDFEKLDIIFLKNHDEMDNYRIKALIEYTINKYCYETGDTLILKEELFLRLKKCFKSNFNLTSFLACIDLLTEENKVISFGDSIALYNYYIVEKNIYNKINSINKIKEKIRDEDIDKYIRKYEKKVNIKFNNEQIDAIKGAIKNNFYIITGGPGTGKTTIISAIVEIIKTYNKVDSKDFALLGPTGRSAKRLSESVNLQGYTIHKFLKWNKEIGTFQIDEYNKAKEKIIIVDESSMVDIFLFNSLLNGLRNDVKLILVGDTNQLPSIGPGDILNDLLKMDIIENKFLKTIYRVKEGSYISYLAEDIRNQRQFEKIDNYSDFKFIESSDENIKIYLKEICGKVSNKKISIDNFQVLAPMYKGLNGIDSLNDMMADIFNLNNEKYEIGGKIYRKNDKVIQLVNDIENNVFNGDIGYINDIRKIDNKIYVEIDYNNGNIVEYKTGELDKFTLAYAISIHKSQGSEYDNVVVILAKSFNRMFYNKLIYTAVTRAKSSLIIIGTIDSFNKSISTLYSTNRNTMLKMYKNFQ